MLAVSKITNGDHVIRLCRRCLSTTNDAMIRTLKGMLYHKRRQYTDDERICNAMNIYNKMIAGNLDPKQYSLMINLLLKIFLNSEHPEKVAVIWSDLRSQNQDKQQQISYLLFIKCYLQLNDIDTCIHLLEWMKQIRYKLPRNQRKDYSVIISKIISQCQNKDQLQKITYLIDVNDSYITTALINAYGSYSDMDAALNVFDNTADQHKDQVMIGAVMNQLIDNRKYKIALDIYDQHKSLHNDVAHMFAIQACTESDDFDTGQKIHQSIRKKYDLNECMALKNSLITFYGNFKDVESAMDIFENGKMNNGVTLNSMMTVFINNEKYDDALSLFDTYQFFRNDVSYILAIRACIFIPDYETGKHLIQCNKLLQQYHNNTHLLNTLIEFYGHFNDLSNASQVFDEIKTDTKDEYTVISMMKAYINQDEYRQALDLYHDISDELKTDSSNIMAINACKYLNDFERGKQIHHHILNKFGLSVSFTSSLIEFYSYFGDTNLAYHVFNGNRDMILEIMVPMIKAYIKQNMINEAIELYHKPAYFDQVSHDKTILNALLKELVHYGNFEEALTVYDRNSEIIDNASHTLAIKACINLDNFNKGIEIHRNIENLTDCIDSPFIQTALIDLYGSFGEIDAALNIFNTIQIDKQNIAMINAMMNAYSNNNLDRKCMDFFQNIEKHYNIKPDVISYAIVLKACKQATALHLGQQIHAQLTSAMLINTDIQINLINLYGKCGRLSICEEIMEGIKQNEPKKYHSEISIWNALIHSYGRNGKVWESMELYKKMKDDIGIKPNEKTFAILLDVCSHCGNMDQAERIWGMEIKDDKYKYDRYIITSLIDGFCRKGLINKGKEFILQYESHNNHKQNTKYDKLGNEVMWMSLLNACKVHKDNDLNIEDIALEIYNEIEQRFKHDEKRMASASVTLSNIYASKSVS